MAGRIQVILMINTEADVHNVADELQQWFSSDNSSWETGTGIEYVINDAQVIVTED